MGKETGSFDHGYLTDEVSDDRGVVGMRIPFPYDARPRCRHEEAVGGLCLDLVKPASTGDGNVGEGQN